MLDNKGYITRRSCNRKSIIRNWWLVKAKGNNDKGKFIMGALSLGTITLPKEFIGERVRLKLEVVKK